MTRFLLHILPQSFVRIRNFGFLANRRRTALLPLCFQLLGTTLEPPAEEHSSSTKDPADLYRCPNCGGPMRIIERLTAAEIQLRSPRHRCGMKPLSPTRSLCVSRRAPYLSAAPLNKFPCKSSSKTVLAILSCSRRLIAWRCEGPCSAAQPRYTSILALPLN